MKKEILLLGSIVGLHMASVAHAEEKNDGQQSRSESQAQDSQPGDLENSFVKTLADMFGISAVLKDIKSISPATQEVGPEN